jgi:PDDEXK-like domain of unknown function (DUF3799)
VSTPTLTITKPGVYDIPEEDYHRDPVPGGSLSSTGARKLLAPSCPALFRYQQDNPQPPKKTFDIGSAAHQLVLGSGPELIEIEHDRWDTKVAKAEVAAAREAGAIPLHPADYAQVHAMADALRAHPIASALFNPDFGKPEQSLFWQDVRSGGTWRRARLDWLPTTTRGRMIVSDYKTCVSAEPTAISKAMATFSLHQQADWYRDGVMELGLAGDAAFVFVFQEKTAPYLITVAEPDVKSLNLADAQNQKAIDVYRHCTETGVWPAYADDVVLTSLPAWSEKQLELARDRGDYDLLEKSR